ncbi:MAG: helix-turn-helix transcriptional regulator [Armatimonadetes bacterium]|nr:helix-turn-helix transcriptional regulator [Armatimonadota bacterium]
MRTGFARTSAVPSTAPLHTAPLLHVPLREPPVIEWLGVGTHGRFAREDYRLPHLWCLHLYSWTGVLRAADTTLPVAPGYVSLVAPDTPLSHFFRPQDPPAVHLTCGFRLAAPGSEPGFLLPVMSDTDAAFGTLRGLYEKAVAVFPFAPRRAESVIWDILWRLVETPASTETPLYPVATPRTDVVTRLRETIELRLSEPLRVAELAELAGLSHNHLTRLFHAVTGKTVVAYVRERRIERATRLLKHTTMPVKQIAAQVGLPDLQAFNKAIRAATRVSPRGVRAGLKAGSDG